MFVLHVKIKMKPGQAAAAEKVFAGPFKAAITAQPGFRDYTDQGLATMARQGVVRSAAETL